MLRPLQQLRFPLALTAASLLSAGLVSAPVSAQQADAAAGGAAQQVPPPPQARPLQRLGDRVREGVGRAVGEAGEQVGRVIDRVLPRDQIATSELEVVAEDQGLRVREVYPDSYASRLELQPGDRIVALDDQPIRSQAEFYDLWSTRATSYPTVVVLRDGQRVILRGPELVEVPASEGRPVLGVYLTDTALGPQVRQVVPGSAADQAGIAVGDYIVSVNNARTETEAQVTAAVSQHPVGQPMHLTYQRRNHNTDLLVRFFDPAGDGAPSVDVDTTVRVAKPALPAEPDATATDAELLRRLRNLEAEVQQLRGAVKVLTEQNAD